MYKIIIVIIIWVIFFVVFMVLVCFWFWLGFFFGILCDYNLWYIIVYRIVIINRGRVMLIVVKIMWEII